MMKRRRVKREWYPLASAGELTLPHYFPLQPGTGEMICRTGLHQSGTGTDRGVRGVVRASSGTVPVLFSQTALESNDPFRPGAKQ
ncbi:MAG: hypothetical protein CM1200mP39_22380 [Dehalococcoidia bacterium]|nr:MAG: hypothetical protein CM1200mP39_22380 [Dehalococcoidia bacterium]